MDGKSTPIVNNTGPRTDKPEVPGKKQRTGRMGSHKTRVQKTVTKAIPSKNQNTPFHRLDSMFVPQPSDFFTLFEQRHMSGSSESCLNRLKGFNHSLLEHMGFPEDSRSFFSDWALIDAELATPLDDSQSESLIEARKLFDGNKTEKSRKTEETRKKVDTYSEAKGIELRPAKHKATRQAFTRLWQFFQTLFTSPFSLLSNKKEHDDYQNTLTVLRQRVKSSPVDNSRSRSVQITSARSHIKQSETSVDEIQQQERQNEISFIRKAPEGTPVYYENTLYFVKSAGESTMTLYMPSTEKTETEPQQVEAEASELFLPPAYSEATRICNPGDVDLPSDTPISEAREKELLYICAHLTKDDKVLYKGKPAVVSTISPDKLSPQIRVTLEDGTDIDAALRYLEIVQEGAPQ